MTMTINFRASGCNFEEAVKAAIISLTGMHVENVECLVRPADENIPLCAEWEISPKGVADAVCVVDGDILRMSIN